MKTKYVLKSNISATCSILHFFLICKKYFSMLDNGRFLKVSYFLKTKTCCWVLYINTFCQRWSRNGDKCINHMLRSNKSYSFSNTVPTGMCFLLLAGGMRMTWNSWTAHSSGILMQRNFKESRLLGQTVSTPEEERWAFCSPDGSNALKTQSLICNQITEVALKVK